MLDAWMHWLGFGLCHQLPERSFFAGGLQVPVCARDTGIYLGFLVSLAVLAVLTRGRRPSELPSWPLLALAGIFAAAMAFDGVMSYTGLRATTNDIRLVTGLAAGYAMPLLVLPMLNGQLWHHPGRDRVLDGYAATLVWLGWLPATFAAIRWALPLLSVGYPVLVGVAIVVTFVVVNMVIVSLVPRLGQRAGRLRETWPIVLLAFGLSGAEIAASAWLRYAVTAALSR